MLEKKAADQRIHRRFNKVFPVILSSEVYGDTDAVARNISDGGMMVEMAFPLPLGSVVTVHIRVPDSDAEVLVRAEVKHQYCYNYSVGADPARARGIGLRFIEFIEDTRERFEAILRRARTLH